MSYKTKNVMKDTNQKFLETSYADMLREGCLYHGTNSHCLDSIMTYGLHPTKRLPVFDLDELKRFKDLCTKVGITTLHFLDHDNIRGSVSLTAKRKIAESHAGYGLGETGYNVTWDGGRALREKSYMMTAAEKKFLIQIVKKYKNLEDTAEPILLHIDISCPEIPVTWFHSFDEFVRKMDSMELPSWEKAIQALPDFTTDGLDTIRNPIGKKYIKKVEFLEKE
ncbi:MAG: hypothetical protein ABIA21_00600 [Candidatus Aenigmatarchaeota archaeon]